MAESLITGTVNSGSQQQFFTRNTKVGRWAGGVWNMVYVGSQGVPSDKCGKTATVEATPTIVEKPFIVANGEGYSIMVPQL